MRIKAFASRLKIRGTDGFIPIELPIAIAGLSLRRYPCNHMQLDADDEIEGSGFGWICATYLGLQSNHHVPCVLHLMLGESVRGRAGFIRLQGDNASEELEPLGEPVEAEDLARATAGIFVRLFLSNKQFDTLIESLSFHKTKELQPTLICTAVSLPDSTSEAAPDADITRWAIEMWPYAVADVLRHPYWRINAYDL